jgi:GH24 family phage-related lysozyme (muramidase)
VIDNGPDLTKNHEGYVEGVYLDSLGYPSTGFGICLDWSRPYQSVREYHEAAFANRYGEAVADYDNLGLDLDPVRTAAVVDLLYNLGPVKFAKFTSTLAALKMRDWNLAAACLENSRWFKQVGRRGPRICKLIREGRWEAL